MNSNTLFWIVNAAGWFAYLLFASLFFGYFTGSLSSNTLLINVAAFLYFVPATGFLRYFIKRLGWPEQQQWLKLIPILIVTNYLISLLGQLLISLFMIYGLNMMDWSQYSIPKLMIFSAQQWFVLCLWTLIYMVVKQFRNNRQQQLKHIQLEAALRATELQALKAQLNPHFIFNCLNNMRALAIDDGATTRQMITHLSEILKYSFQYGEATHVTVAQEIQHVKNYLALEDIQFEQRLTYEFGVDPAAETLNIPFLSIQLLVENAIKHGIMGLPQGGQIHIGVHVSGSQLAITVSNTGTLAANPNNQTSGVGLVNLQQRLQLLYNGQANFQLQAIDHDQVMAQITLPLEASS